MSKTQKTASKIWSYIGKQPECICTVRFGTLDFDLIVPRGEISNATNSVRDYLKLVSSKLDEIYLSAKKKLT